MVVTGGRDTYLRTTNDEGSTGIDVDHCVLIHVLGGNYLVHHLLENLRSQLFYRDVGAVLH